MSSLTGKTVLMILASSDFRDPEFTTPKGVIEASGANTLTSSTTPISTGAEGLKVKVDVLLKDIDTSRYDAVVFIGGPGSTQYFDDPIAHKICTETLKHDKILASICAAGSTLARSGVLKGKKATAFESRGQDLNAHGAIYTGKQVEVDGNIITANGPGAAKAFGEALIKALSK